MEWSNDPELVKIFVAETAERSARLVNAPAAMAEGGGDPRIARTAARDAHTLKGNFAMLGYELLSGAAAALEEAWSRIAEGEHELGPAYGSSLSALAAALMPALEHGEAALGPACRAVCRPLGRECPFADDRDQPRNDTFYGLAHDRPELDGLLTRTRGLVLGDAVRVDAGRLYEVINRAVEVRLDVDALVEALRQEVGEGAWSEAAEALRVALAKLQGEAALLATAPLSEITVTLGQLVRYIANRTGKQVRVDVAGDEIEVDRQLLDVLREPLRHLVVNAVDHGCERPAERAALGKPEVAEIRLRFSTDGSTLRISVSDDGRGVEWDEVEAAAGAAGLLGDGIVTRTDLEQLLLTQELSTGGSGDGFSGDGDGLSLVARVVDQVHGGLRIDSLPGSGTSVSISVPSSLALQDVLLVRCAGMRWGVPKAAVVEVVEYQPSALVVDGLDIGYRHGGTSVPFVALSQLLGRGGDEPTREVVVLTTRAGLVGLGVPAVLTNRPVAVKRLGGVLAGNEFLAGAALLGGGDMVVVVEPNGIEVAGVGALDRPLVAVVDDSRAVRQLLAATLASGGFEVETVGDRSALFDLLAARDVELVVVDFHLDDDDGISLAAALADRYPELPVVMLSGVAGDHEEEEARRVGVRDVFHKAGLGDGGFLESIRRLVDQAVPEEVSA